MQCVEPFADIRLKMKWFLVHFFDSEKDGWDRCENVSKTAFIQFMLIF